MDHSQSETVDGSTNNSSVGLCLGCGLKAYFLFNRNVCCALVSAADTQSGLTLRLRAHGLLNGRLPTLA